MTNFSNIVYHHQQVGIFKHLHIQIKYNMDQFQIVK